MANETVWTVTAFAAVVITVLLGVPVLAYMVAKMATLGYWHGRQQAMATDNLKGDESGKG